jgi:hypothetical protein
MRDRRRALLKPIGSLETLDDRLLLTAGIEIVVHAPTALHGTLNSSDIIQDGPLKLKGGQQLTTLYDEFVQKGTVDKTLASVMQIQGTTVLISVVATPGQYSSLSSSLKTLGMQIQSSPLDATYNTVSGYVSISELLNVANLQQTSTMSAPRPRLSPRFGRL